MEENFELESCRVSKETELKLKDLLKSDNGCITDVRTVVVFRKNMLKRCKGTPFEKVDLDCFEYDKTISSFRFSCVQDIIMFIDEGSNSRTKILKNRYGRPGEVK